MIGKNILKQIIYEQAVFSLPSIVERKIDQRYLDTEEIVIISGIRRCGKSVLLRQIQSKHSDRDYFMNFDDERLRMFSVDDFSTLQETFIELFGIQHIYYFDEIQNIEGWEQFVRRLYDAGNKVYVTGSNARMLSRELGTHLTGRYLPLTLYPFSFHEMLLLKGVSIQSKDLYTSDGRATIKSFFNEFLLNGGIPRYLLRHEDDYLSALYESIIYRDVLTRHNISNEREMLELMFCIVSQTSQRFTYNSLAKAVKIKHPDTIRNYLSFVSDAYLFFTVSKFDYSLKGQMASPKKSYLIDNALVRKIGFNATNNIGPLLENLVFVELMRRGGDLFYHQDKKECDFVVRKGNEIVAAYQVSADVSSSLTLKREIGGLEEAMKKYGLSEGTIITVDDEDMLVREGYTINIIPAWKWLLKPLQED